MINLNLPKYPIRLKEVEGKKMIFDSVRKKFLVLTPEEWVRQNFIFYLATEKKMPLSLIAVEMGLTLNKTKKRSDIVVYNKTGNAWLIVECKAPSVKIDQKVFDQIARYNLTLNAEFLVVTNGLQHYCCQMFPREERYSFLPDIPEFPD